MGKKIFVSYKYKDSDVNKLDGVVGATWACDYVDYIQENIFNSEDDNIYKGEKSDEDLSDKSDDYIWEHLKDKIYDSTVTIVLVSPNMKEKFKAEKNQWIPWEISYSVRKTTRAGRTSQRNALLVVKLPDSDNSYDYFDDLKLFSILKGNIDNGLAYVTKWDDFVLYPNTCIKLALDRLDSIDDDSIVKSV